MVRLFALLMFVFLVSCSRSDTPYRYFPIEEQAVSLASVNCTNPKELDWLRAVIKQAEVDHQFKGSIYAIPYQSETVFLHETWISNCIGCHMYDCEGEPVALSASEKSLVMASAKAEYLIYTSSQ